MPFALSGVTLSLMKGNAVETLYTKVPLPQARSAVDFAAKIARIHSGRS
jgi:hypothetical protein